MQYSVLNIKETVGDFRIDAEVYLPKFLNIEKILGEMEHTTIKKEVKVFAKGIFDIKAECYLEREGIPFIRIGDLGNVLLNDSYVRIPELENEKNRKTFLKRGDLVLSKTAYAAASLVSIDFCNVSQDIIAVKLKDNSLVNSRYLAIFLNCRYGFLQMQRWFSGNIQSHLNLSDSSTIKIPILDNSFQILIEKYVEQALELKMKSAELYFNAEQILLSELGLVNWKPKHQLSFNRSFSDTNYADRIDAEYFQPKYDEIKEILNRGKCVPLAKCFDLLSGTYFDYVDEGDVGVIKTKQLNDRFISFEVESKTSEKILRDNNLPEIRDEDVLFASMGVGSLGKANIYYEFENSIKGKFTIDSTIKIMRQKPNSEIRPELLALYMSSIIGQELIYQNIVGTSGIISIYKHYLENLPIPLLGRSIQDSLSASIMQAHKSRIKSNKLLDIAKRGVELAIEKSEEEAEKWLSEEVGKCQITM